MMADTKKTLTSTEVAAELGIDAADTEGLNLTAETLEELTNGKGEDEDE